MQAIESGCHLQEASFLLRYPEVTLSDLSNPPPPLNQTDAETILQFHQAVANADLGASGRRGISRIAGDGLDTEVCFCGPDRQDLESFKKDVMSISLDSVDFRPRVRLPPYRALGLVESRRLSKISSESLAMRNAVLARYRESIHGQYLDKIRMNSTNTVFQDHVVWNEIEQLADNFLLVLCAGLSMATAFCHSTGVDRVGFTEIHRQNDPYMLYRKTCVGDIFPTTTSKSGSWAVVDKAYTGGTICKAALHLRENMGVTGEILTVGMFPKSFEAFARLDYVVYAGRLHDCRELRGSICREHWHEELLQLSSTS